MRLEATKEKCQGGAKLAPAPSQVGLMNVLKYFRVVMFLKVYCSLALIAATRTEDTLFDQVCTKKNTSSDLRIPACLIHPE